MSQGNLGPGSTGVVVDSKRSFADRLFGALKLDATVYEEVEHDPTALSQAALVVALGAFAQGAGMASDGGQGAVVAGIVGAFLGWFLGTAIVWIIGVKIMKHTSDYPELLRTLGFASAPSLLFALGVLPLGSLRGVVAVAVWLLTTIAYVIAARQALDVTTGRAVFICVLASLAPVLLVFVISMFVIGAAGVTGSPGAMAP
jgi:hypothetical protein